jgi:hypothetical protein
MPQGIPEHFGHGQRRAKETLGSQRGGYKQRKEHDMSCSILLDGTNLFSLGRVWEIWVLGRFQEAHERFNLSCQKSMSVDTIFELSEERSHTEHMINT